jgi:hypothetical protein
LAARGTPPSLPGFKRGVGAEIGAPSVERGIGDATVMDAAAVGCAQRFCCQSLACWIERYQSKTNSTQSFCPLLSIAINHHAKFMENRGSPTDVIDGDRCVFGPARCKKSWDEAGVNIRKIPAANFT